MFGWAVIIGSIPIGIVGLLFKDTIETTLRSLWFVGCALILWSFVMWFADRARHAGPRRGRRDVARHPHHRHSRSVWRSSRACPAPAPP